MKVAGFDWDDGNREKCAKHGVLLTEIEAVFRHRPHVAPDIAHSDIEARFLAIGKGDEGRFIFVACTLRKIEGETFIRPISARYMHRKEIEHYEKAASNLDH